MDIDRSLITLQVGESVSVIERGMAGKIDTTIVEEETDAEKQFTCTRTHAQTQIHTHTQRILRTSPNKQPPLHSPL
jgi:hypothetical protein